MINADDDHGRSATRPWQVPTSGWREILLRTWNESSKDNIGLVAAGVAFYAFLAIVPLLGATVLTYGLIASPRSVIANIGSLAHILPRDIAELIGGQLINVVHASSGKKGIGVLVGLAVAMFGARNAAGSIIIALNIAYEEEEKRGFFRVTLLALAMTGAAVVLALLGIGAIGVLEYIGRLLPTAPIVAAIGKIVVPLALAVGGAGAAAALYRYGPSRERAEWSWLTPGSLLSAVGWLAVTGGFGLYLTKFAHYDASYGALGGVVALLTWIYLSSYVFLFGAELNSEVEHQTAHDTTEGAEAPLGERGAWSADHVASGGNDRGRAAEGGCSPTPSSEPPAPEKGCVTKPNEHAYLTSRIATRAGRFAGIPSIGTLSSILSTVGLGMLRKRGKVRVGSALIATAAGLALMRRDPADQAADSNR